MRATAGTVFDSAGRADAIAVGIAAALAVLRLPLELS